VRQTFCLFGETVVCTLVLGTSVSWRFWPCRFKIIYLIELVKLKIRIFCLRVLVFCSSFLLVV